MKRGEIWWVNFEPAVGGEIRKRRPAVIVSNDIANKHLNRLQVVPLTSNVAKVYACEALVQVKGRPNKAKADLIATVSKTRLTNKVGKVKKAELSDFEKAIKIQLGLS